MQNTYNFYNLEASFREYLLAGNNKSVSIKNYLSDYRHFTGWVTFYLQSNVNQNDISLQSDQDIIVRFLTEANIQEYKKYLSENNIPHRTINRRLSTVRKLCSFCISQGWLKENPGKQIINIQPKNTNKMTHFLKEFELALKQKGFDNNAITSSLNDIQEFLSI